MIAVLFGILTCLLIDVKAQVNFAGKPKGEYEQPPPGGYGALPPEGFGAPPPGGYGAPPLGGYGPLFYGNYGTPPPEGYGAPPPRGYGAPPPGGYGAPPSGGYGALPPGGYGEYAKNYGIYSMNSYSSTLKSDSKDDFTDSWLDTKSTSYDRNSGSSLTSISMVLICSILLSRASCFLF